MAVCPTLSLVSEWFLINIHAFGLITTQAIIPFTTFASFHFESHQGMCFDRPRSYGICILLLIHIF